MTRIRKFDGDYPTFNYGGRALSTDEMAMTPRIKAVRAAHLALFQLQDLDSPEEIVLGVAVLHEAICRRMALDMASLNAMAKRIIDAPPEGDHMTDNAVQSLNDWIMGRIAAKEVTIA